MFSFLFSRFDFNSKVHIYKSITSTSMPHDSLRTRIMSKRMWFSNIAKIRLSAIAWYDLTGKCCNCCCRLSVVQFTEYMALIIMRWCWTSSYKRKDCPVRNEKHKNEFVNHLFQQQQKKQLILISKKFLARTYC